MHRNRNDVPLSHSVGFVSFSFVSLPILKNENTKSIAIHFQIISSHHSIGILLAFSNMILILCYLVIVLLFQNSNIILIEDYVKFSDKRGVSSVFNFCLSSHWK